MKIGDYVRTDYGIGKIIEILQPTDVDEPDLKLDVSDCNDYPYIFKSEVMKSSPNIIDLIEVGDYVNGCPVLHKEGNELVCGLILRYKEKNIQNIVTKEQFEAIQYNLESQVTSNE